MYEIVGNAYGRADAPWIWTKKVIKTFHGLGFLYIDGAVVACALIHVDGLLIAWNAGLFDIDLVRQTLDLRNWLEAAESVEWNGREIHFVLHLPRGLKAIVTVSNYLRKQRVADNSPLGFPELSEMNGIVGDLQYAAST